jgi:hypothetical protein
MRPNDGMGDQTMAAKQGTALTDSAVSRPASESSERSVVLPPASPQGYTPNEMQLELVKGLAAWVRNSDTVTPAAAAAGKEVE